jgi:hypothetical protein
MFTFLISHSFDIRAYRDWFRATTITVSSHEDIKCSVTGLSFGLPSSLAFMSLLSLSA